MYWQVDYLPLPGPQERFRGPGVQGPGLGWNYPDALFVGKVQPHHPTTLGKGGMREAEYRSMFALWSIVKAPLMLGTDLTTLTRNSLILTLTALTRDTLILTLTALTRESAAYSIITNPGLLAVNQDPLGTQARIGCHTRMCQCTMGYTRQ